MKNKIAQLVDKIGTCETILESDEVINLTYDFNINAKEGESIINLTFKDYLITYKVDGADIKINAKIVKGREETPLLSDIIAHTAAVLYQEAIKPYLNNNGNPPVTLFPRAVREFFDMMAIQLDAEYPTSQVNIVDKACLGRLPIPPASIMRHSFKH